MDWTILALVAVVALASCAAGSLAALCYRAGLRDGLAVRQNKDPGPVLPLPTAAPQQASEQDKRLDAILANVEAYDGTTLGQEEVS